MKEKLIDHKKILESINIILAEYKKTPPNYKKIIKLCNEINHYYDTKPESDNKQEDPEMKPEDPKINNKDYKKLEILDIIFVEYESMNWKNAFKLFHDIKDETDYFKSKKNFKINVDMNNYKTKLVYLDNILTEYDKMSPDWNEIDTLFNKIKNMSNKDSYKIKPESSKIPKINILKKKFDRI